MTTTEQPSPEMPDTPGPVPVRVRGLRIALTGSGSDIVDEISIDIAPGEVLGLVGESGSGKTTVGMSLLGYCRPGGKVAGGEVLIEGITLASLRSDALRGLRGGVVSYIPQDPGTSLNPALRIRTQLFETLEEHDERDSSRKDARIREALEEVALPSDDEFLRRYPHQLSGGQQQRVAIAMAFAPRPKVIVCDEPTTGLDVTTQARVLETIRDLCLSHKVAALYVSHDLAVVADLADHVAVMYAGRIVEAGTRDQMFSAPSHPYTARLLRAVPDIQGKRPVIGIRGRAPLPGRRPQGCFFVDRCHLAADQCHTAFPPVEQIGPEHSVRCYRWKDTAGSLPPGEVGPPDVTKLGERVLTVRTLNAKHGARETLFDINIAVARQECLALVGESGSGKTTLARCIAGLHSDWTGDVSLGDAALQTAARRRSTEVRRRIQYVFQNPYASLNPRRTVGQTLARQFKLFFPDSREDMSARVTAILEQVALSGDAINRFPDQLSGGERQRVAIARAMAAEPELLVCDEVTSALDVSVQAAIIDLLRQLRLDTGLSILFITHDLALIRTIADRVAVMTEGRIVEEGAVGRIFDAPEAPYTRQLLENTPSIEAALARVGSDA
jgi:peptide/nickel transport system ATP-binding protein